MPLLDPVDNGFGRHVAILAGFKNGEYVLHGWLLFEFTVIIVFTINIVCIVCQVFF
jgi:hypothetical protein